MQTCAPSLRALVRSTHCNRCLRHRTWSVAWIAVTILRWPMMRVPGHSFASLKRVELQPSVKYFIDGTYLYWVSLHEHGHAPLTLIWCNLFEGTKHYKTFDDYVSFSMVWKHAKYVTEQQLMLHHEAFSQGVAPGAIICIYQEPKTSRWPGKVGGSLDAEVVETSFHFDTERYGCKLCISANPHSKTQKSVCRRLLLSSLVL